MSKSRVENNESVLTEVQDGNLPSQALLDSVQGGYLENTSRVEVQGDQTDNAAVGIEPEDTLDRVDRGVRKSNRNSKKVKK